jgi:hypothetical protein
MYTHFALIPQTEPCETRGRIVTGIVAIGCDDSVGTHRQLKAESSVWCNRSDEPAICEEKLGYTEIIREDQHRGCGATHAMARNAILCMRESRNYERNGEQNGATKSLHGDILECEWSLVTTG